MTMYFQTIKNALRSTLAANAQAGRFTVRTFQQSKREADTIAEYNRQVTIFYKSGSFASPSRPASGVVQHDMVFQLELVVMAASIVDLNTLDDPQANNAQRQSALGAFLDAGQHADDLLDDFWVQIFGILMNPTNYDLGLPVGTVSETPGQIRLNDFEKSDVGREGQYAALVGTCTFKVRCTETPAGDTSNQPLVGLQNNVQISDDIINGILDTAPAGTDVEGGV